MRIVLVAALLFTTTAFGQGDPPLPRPRPSTPAPAAEAAAPVPVEAAPAAERIYQTACPAMLQGRVAAVMLPPIDEGQCREQSPLSVTGLLVNGRMLELSSPITTTCEMAEAMPGWAEAIDGYVDSRLDTRLASILTGTGYQCRGVNGSEEGRLSEHGLANAVDVAGFTLEDGRTVLVESGWPAAGKDEGRLLRFAHDAACSVFTTTLGPEANADHHDHLHLDMGCHGERCTARLCE